jgi:hypothetical protein
MFFRGMAGHKFFEIHSDNHMNDIISRRERKAESFNVKVDDTYGCVLKGSFAYPTV